MINPFTTFIGSTDDVYSYIWFLNNAHQSLISHKLSDLFYTHSLFYPHGVSLRFDTPLFNSLITFPAYVIGGPVFAYNFLAFFTFVFTFIGMFLFLRLLTKNAQAALIGALGFTFSSYRLSRLMVGHMDLLSTEWIGFLLYVTYAYFFVKNENKYILGAGVFIALSAYSDYRTALMSLVLWGVVVGYIGYEAIRHRRIRRWVLFSVCSILTSFVLLIPMLIVHKESLFLAGRYFPSEFQFIEEGSADVSWFFYSIGRSSFFLGWVSLFLLFIAVILRKKSRKRLHAVLWSVIFFFFSFVMMGMRIQVLGQTLYRGILMPYSIFLYSPILRYLHRPSRFGLIIHVAWAVLVSYAVVLLLNRIQHKRIQTVFVMILACAIVGQYIWYFRFPLTVYKPSKAAHIIQTAKQGSVLAIPFGYIDAFYKASSMDYQEEILQQLFFHKPLLGGYVTYIDDKTITWYHKNRLLQKIRTCQETKICIDFTKQEKKELKDFFHVSVIWIVYQDKYKHMTSYLKKQYPDAVQKQTDNSIILLL